jgi:hypothetical protein
MASDHYNSCIVEIQEHFGVSETCARYIFHRVLRSRRKDDKYLEWNIKLQNALIKADKCLGIRWETISFGVEQDELKAHGISVHDMDDAVFTWREPHDLSEPHPVDSEWIIVSRKKNRSKKKKLLISRMGIFT